jgi:hypothetical protein
MVQIVLPWLSERHVPKRFHVTLPCHNVVWLGLVPPSPPLLLPSPACPLSLLLTLSLEKIAGRIGNVDVVKEVGNDLLLHGLPGPKVDVEVP